MKGQIKNQEAILQKLGIVSLNDMQIAVINALESTSELIVLSPTGSGKTLAFTLPLLSKLNADSNDIQALILVPARELAIQIEQVIREMGSGYKVNAVYGGRAGAKDKIDLQHAPAILVGTPGRIADHIRRENIKTNAIKTLILDEYDKSLEIGFEVEMREIIEALPNLTSKVLTSATELKSMPSFVELTKPKVLNFLGEAKPQIEVKKTFVKNANNLETLLAILSHVGDANGIVFCNLKESLENVSDYLYDLNIGHACFYGGLEQQDRERALIKFRNGTCKILLATDLAARGIDVPELDFIIHYELPRHKEEFIHRNGRTARMNSKGTAYIIGNEKQSLADFAAHAEEIILPKTNKVVDSNWETLFVSGGRKDKISKGDIAGFFFKQGHLEKEELGMIEIKNDCTFVAVPRLKVDRLIKLLNNLHLKKRKLRLSHLE